MHDYRNMFDLSRKTAIVTGGAKGLGRVFAQALGQSGAKVVIADKDAQGAEQTASELCREGIVCSAIGVDVTDEQQVEQMVRETVERYGSLDVLVNNAGILSRDPAVEQTLESWQRVMDININGVFLCAKHAGRQMIATQTKGSIINISSMCGLIVNTPLTQSAYNTSKGAVIMATKSFASEWAQHGIRVNAIAPGYMRTEMTGESFQPGGEHHALLDYVPMKRLGEPSELAGALILLASEASSFMTGSVLVVDGGYTIW